MELYSSRPVSGARAGVFNGLKRGVSVHRCFFKGYRQPETVRNAFPDVAENNMDPGLYQGTARADRSRRCDCTGTRTDARETRPWGTSYPLHRPLCHVPAKHRTDRPMTAKPARGLDIYSYGRQRPHRRYAYQRQFRTDFRVRAGHVLTWLRFPKG